MKIGRKSGVIPGIEKDMSEIGFVGLTNVDVGLTKSVVGRTIGLVGLTNSNEIGQTATHL